MTLTVLLRDFLIVRKAKRRFEENMLACQPQLVGPDGRFDWTGGKYENYVRSIIKRRGYSFCLENMLGFEIGSATFSWSSTKEGADYWGKLCRDFPKFGELKQKI